MRKLLHIVILTFIFFPVSFSQVTKNGNFYSYVTSIINNIPASGSQLYTQPMSGNLLQWSSTINDLLSGNYNSCHTNCSSLGYQLTIYTDAQSSNVYYILEKTSSGSNYWGTYIYNPSACNNHLIIQAPHAKFDSNTGQEALLTYLHTEAFFLMISGTHRCDQSSYSSCSGTTTACGTSESFRISDMAHNINTIFQATTEQLNDGNTYFIQLHGFSKQSTDPSVIMSNGTRVTPADDKIVTIKQNLFAINNSLTFEVAHINTSWTKLIAFTNTQGRLINNVTNPCNTSATNTFGKFIHLEQEKPLLRQDSSKWIVMAEAIKQSFPCNSSQINEQNLNKLKVYPNPSRDKIYITSTSNLISGEYFLFNMYGQLVESKTFRNSNSITIKKQPSGFYTIKIVSPHDGSISQNKLIFTD